MLTHNEASTGRTPLESRATASREIREAGISPSQILAIAERVGITVSAVYARIKAGDKGERLLRAKENKGPHRQMAGVKRATVARVLREPVARAKPVLPKSHQAVPLEIERRAEMIGIPRTLLLARQEAGWPQHRLLDLPKRWRHRRLASV